MKFRQLTATNDWTFGGGLSNYASGQQAIALNIQTSILMFAGDFFASLSGWINWRGLLNVGQQKNLDTALQTLLSQCYGVQGIISANVVVNKTTRKFFASYVVDTVYSQQVVNQVQILSGQGQAS
jgi:hypothetical protein